MLQIPARPPLSADEMVSRAARRLSLLSKLLFDNAVGSVQDTLSADEQVALSEYLEDLRDDLLAAEEQRVAADRAA